MTHSAGVGGVREETALLVEAIRGLTGRPSGHPAADAAPGAAQPRAASDSSQSSQPSGHPDGGPCQTCGCQAPYVCSGCPVCRSAATIRSMAPSALEQMADLALMVADSLRVAAHTRRGSSAGTTHHHPTPPDEGAAP